MSKKASDLIQYYQNNDGPMISNISRKIIEQDGNYYKDIDGSGTLSIVNDWHNCPKQRAEAYIHVLSNEEKVSQLFTSDWRMGPKYPRIKGHTPIGDETGILDEAQVHTTTIFGKQDLPGTTTLIQDWLIRHTILRDNALAEDLADYHNQLHYLAEGCHHFIPVETMSNSRNENGEVVFGMNDGAGVLTTYPGTLGIAAAILGENNLEIADHFGQVIKKEWNAAGLRKGYMYMADCVTDPRWQRTFGTFGENPELISNIFSHIIPAIQGSADGPTLDGVAVTTKHFPGGGARENGFDPHYKAGQWNVYATPNSLEDYHLPAFKAAVAKNTSAIMPYYSKPSQAKSAVQYDPLGNPIDFQPYGFAYNKYFIDEILRKQLGFKGYVNSDTGIVHNMCWGVEDLDLPERIGFAINHSGVDLISGLFDQEAGKEALARSTNDYYETHKVPKGYTKEDLVLTQESLDRAVTRTLTEMFTLGLFDNPYRDPQKAKETAKQMNEQAYANEVHQKSVVLLKNDGTLPLQKSNIYAKVFSKGDTSAMTAALQKVIGRKHEIVQNIQDADTAYLMLYPKSGNYFNATPGYLELEICENKTVHDVSEDGRPLAATHKETTLEGMDEIKSIAKMIHSKGGKVVIAINFPLAWDLSQIEPLADSLLAGFDTYPEAIVDIVNGMDPIGKLPITLPRGDAVLAVNEDGVCISPNDVPGYDKDKYMPESLKDENGKAYAYKDSCGHYYEYGFGLKY